MNKNKIKMQAWMVFKIDKPFGNINEVWVFRKTKIKVTFFSRVSSVNCMLKQCLR